jgi:hypothetical protein
MVKSSSLPGIFNVAGSPTGLSPVRMAKSEQALR